jgi:glyoxylase-like metal-dependent hydrolase (beta-lactamase superfamily II)
MTRPLVESFFHTATWTISHIVHAGPGSVCAVIDPVLDFDPRSGRTGTAFLDRMAGFIRSERLTLAWILETHVHADHLTAAPRLRAELGGRIAIGAGVAAVRKNFLPIFGEEVADPGTFDHLFADGEGFAIGELAAEVLATPGHTPGCVTYVIGDAAFVGDTLFMPDGGSARCDFPGGDAAILYRSIRRILALPPETRIFVCHDYGPGGRPFAWETTVAEQRAHNSHVRDGIAEAEFVEARRARDRTLEMPALLLPAVQVNLRGGELPGPAANGIRYLKLPLDAL